MSNPNGHRFVHHRGEGANVVNDVFVPSTVVERCTRCGMHRRPAIQYRPNPIGERIGWSVWHHSRDGQTWDVAKPACGVAR